MRTNASGSFCRAYSHALRIAMPLPRFRAWRITCAPASAAVSAVSSVDPSSTTTTSLANCRALRTTEPIVVPSLYAGMAAMIFDSGNVFRNTAGTGADSSSSIERFLVTRGRTDLPGSGPEHAPERIMVWAEFSDVGTIQTLRRRERNFYRWEG